MREQEDAFGRALLDYHLGKEAQIVIERDDGNLDVSAEPQMYFREFEAWEAYEKSAMNSVVGRVLDVGSGAGRHSLFLQERGHDVVALDNSPLAIEVVKRRGVRETALMPVTEVSSKLGIFDSIIMMGNNFGLVANKRRAGWLFRRFNKMTSSDGVVIATSLDPHTTDDPVHLRYHEMNRQRGRLVGQVRIRVRYRNLKGLWFDYLLASREEMADLIAGTGWTIREFIESSSPVYVAILRKSG